MLTPHDHPNDPDAAAILQGLVEEFATYLVAEHCERAPDVAKAYAASARPETNPAWFVVAGRIREAIAGKNEAHGPPPPSIVLAYAIGYVAQGMAQQHGTDALRVIEAWLRAQNQPGPAGHAARAFWTSVRGAVLVLSTDDSAAH